MGCNMLLRYRTCFSFFISLLLLLFSVNDVFSIMKPEQGYIDSIEMLKKKIKQHKQIEKVVEPEECDNLLLSVTVYPLFMKIRNEVFLLMMRAFSNHNGGRFDRSEKLDISALAGNTSIKGMHFFSYRSYVDDAIKEILVGLEDSNKTLFKDIKEKEYRTRVGQFMLKVYRKMNWSLMAFCAREFLSDSFINEVPSELIVSTFFNEKIFWQKPFKLMSESLVRNCFSKRNRRFVDFMALECVDMNYVEDKVKNKKNRIVGVEIPVKTEEEEGLQYNVVVFFRPDGNIKEDDFHKIACLSNDFFKKGGGLKRESACLYLPARRIKECCQPPVYNTMMSSKEKEIMIFSLDPSGINVMSSAIDDGERIEDINSKEGVERFVVNGCFVLAILNNNDAGGKNVISLSYIYL